MKTPVRLPSDEMRVHLWPAASPTTPQQTKVIYVNKPATIINSTDNIEDKNADSSEIVETTPPTPMNTGSEINIPDLETITQYQRTTQKGTQTAS